jgi:hypothetical protein
VEFARARADTPVSRAVQAALILGGLYYTISMFELIRQGQAQLQGGARRGGLLRKQHLADGNFLALGISNNLLIIWRPV